MSKLSVPDTKFEDGAKYWLSTPDGSRVLVTATEAGDGEIDISNRWFDFSLWTGARYGYHYMVEPAAVETTEV